MASTASSSLHFDFIVIGGGSGGLAAARRAASYGAKVALIEGDALGGTCVNRGCVPKKMLFNAASLAEAMHDATGYGFEVGPLRFDWAGFVDKRKANIARLNQIYLRNLGNDGVTLFRGWGRLLSPHSIEVTPIARPDSHDALETSPHEVWLESTVQLQSDHILLAPGGSPKRPDVEGAELGIVSDAFFELRHLPERVAIVGSGYIAVELAGVLHALGSQVTLFSRTQRLLRHFDHELGETLKQSMLDHGITIVSDFDVERVTREASGLCLHGKAEQQHAGFSDLIWAVGRSPRVNQLGLENTDVSWTENGVVVSDQFENTNVAGLYALGDATGKKELTPVAIAAGRKLADRLFGGQPDAKLDYHNIPSVIFSHPPIGTVGMSEEEARQHYGDDIKIYRSSFIDTYHSFTPSRARTKMKLITHGPQEKVVGIHSIGRSSDELIQGFAVALKMGATKADLDATVAIHPTAAEELVTMR